MTRLTTLIRATAGAMVLLAGGWAAAPALAAPADVEFLKTFLGDWRGRGVLTGENSETIVCKLSLTAGNDDKINYNGRCSMAGTTLTMAGTIAYIEANRRFETAMTSNVAFDSKAIGRKQGNSIVFTLRDTQEDEEGNDFRIEAAMVLAADKIDVDFNITFVDSGDMLKASVPFTK
jgi:hypothetical protein